ncbi:hypothetical protein [Actinotalea sp. Marseille-Q4924]|uniref:hypothetical protein n=1 Tax=Actinotalea sp. Marseille-Q4924 TaxID=2866571 RepID=UPI001CE3FE2B|nr:hypothetical protein [Actinotalea sp. Marseille-Q4924]
MGSVAAPVALAVVVALAVLVMSALASAGRPAREVVVDARDALRGGLARERWTGLRGGQPEGSLRRRAAGVLEGALRADGPDGTDDDESSVTDLFRVGRPVPDGYVTADRLAAALEKAQGVVVDGVQQVQHRVRR